MKVTDFEQESADYLRLFKAEAAKKFPQITSRHQFKSVKIIFTHNPKSHAGQAWRSSSTIELNLAYYPKYKVEMLTQILGHEFCHILAPLIYGDKGHGHTTQWKAVMKEMGFRPETYHTMEV